MHLPAGLFARFPQGGQKTAAVGVIAEDRLPPVAAAHQVVDRSGKLDAERSGHGRNESIGAVAGQPSIVDYKN